MVLCIVAVAAAAGVSHSVSTPTEGPRTDLIAIDVLLEPDDTMLQEAAEWNAVMRQQSPEGFKLDEQHMPHITLVQRFVATNDLDAVLAAVAGVKAQFAPNMLLMKTKGFYHLPAGKIGVAGIVVEPSTDLLALQEKMIEAVTPFSRTGGGQSAFVPDAAGTPFDPQLFKYVDSFVPARSGGNYNPHVTIGIAPIAWLQNFEKQPFQDFTFRAKGIEVYQLGNFGTASKRLGPNK